MKRFTILVFFSLCANAYADCIITDYSELHEMSQEELTKQYCLNLGEMSRIEKIIKTNRTDNAI